MYFLRLLFDMAHSKRFFAPSGQSREAEDPQIVAASRTRRLLLVMGVAAACAPTPTGERTRVLATKPDAPAEVVDLSAIALREARSTTQAEDEWAAVDLGWGMIVLLPVSEEEAGRLEWAASYESAPEQDSASVVTLDGEVVFVNLSEAPATLPALRAGAIAAHLDSTATNPAVVERLNALCRVRRVSLRYLVYPGQPSVEPLEAATELRELVIDHYGSDPLSLSPLRHLPSLEWLAVGGRVATDSLSDLTELPSLRVLELDQDLTRCELARLQAAMPHTRIQVNDIQEVPCPSRPR